MSRVTSVLNPAEDNPESVVGGVGEQFLETPYYLPPGKTPNGKGKFGAVLYYRWSKNRKVKVMGTLKVPVLPIPHENSKTLFRVGWLRGEEALIKAILLLQHRLQP